MQLEGTKRWRLYDRPDAATCPSADRTTEFGRHDLGAPTQELVLSPGDLLYLPRGVVHEALAQTEGHSLHLTFSTFQRHTFGDLWGAPPRSDPARACVCARAWTCSRLDGAPRTQACTRFTMLCDDSRARVSLEHVRGLSEGPACRHFERLKKSPGWIHSGK